MKLSAPSGPAGIRFVRILVGRVLARLSSWAGGAGDARSTERRATRYHVRGPGSDPAVPTGADMDTKSEVTQLLSRLESGDPDSSERRLAK